eukprot:Hpha_TRINITY_DN22841_c0_g1::TRINITY_DN22841_c0_g1_i1::g.84332::m.84332
MEAHVDVGTGVIRACLGNVVPDQSLHSPGLFYLYPVQDRPKPCAHIHFNRIYHPFRLLNHYVPDTRDRHRRVCDRPYPHFSSPRLLLLPPRPRLRRSFPVREKFPQTRRSRPLRFRLLCFLEVLDWKGLVFPLTAGLELLESRFKLPLFLLTLHFGGVKHLCHLVGKPRAECYMKERIAEGAHRHTHWTLKHPRAHCDDLERRVTRRPLAYGLLVHRIVACRCPPVRSVHNAGSGSRTANHDTTLPVWIGTGTDEELDCWLLDLHQLNEGSVGLVLSECHCLCGHNFETDRLPPRRACCPLLLRLDPVFLRNNRRLRRCLFFLRPSLACTRLHPLKPISVKLRCFHPLESIIIRHCLSLPPPPPVPLTTKSKKYRN